MFDEVFQYFLESQGGSHDSIGRYMKFMSVYALLFKEVA